MPKKHHIPVCTCVHARTHTHTHTHTHSHTPSAHPIQIYIASLLTQVHVRVKIPKTLNADEKKLVEELKELQSKAKVGPFRF